MTELPEERQAAALRRVAELGARKRELQRQLDALMAELRSAALAAHAAGADASRVIELAHIARTTLYDWLHDAGVPLGRPRGRAKRTRGQ